MTTQDYEKSLACLLAWREERSNGLNGMLAVLHVIRNRMASRKFGKSWSDVIAGHHQFSSMTVAGDSQTVAYPEPRDPVFQKLLLLVDGIYDGMTQDKLTLNSLYYADLGSPSFNPDGWFAKVILADPEKYPRVAQIGTTTYFGEQSTDGPTMV